MYHWLKKIGVLLSFFVLGLFLFFIARFLLVNQKIQTIISPKSSSQFSLATAPSQSLTAQVVSFSGNVLWQSRIAKNPTKLTGLVTLQQGEVVETKEKSTLSLEFTHIATIDLSPNSTLNIIQTLPANIVLQQKTGIIDYAVTSTLIPFSVRGLDLLITITGDTEVLVDDTNEKVSVKATSGNATLAYNDTNNISHVVEVKSGQKVTFDNNAKELSGSLVSF